MTSTPHESLGYIGRYQLLARLGSGGMGEVFLAKTSGAAGFEKRVVIKRILPHLSNNQAFVSRFLNEAKLVVQLRHAGIAQILDMGEDNGVYFMAMEYVEGRDLRELLRLGRAGDVRPPYPVVALILVRILEALDHAHRARDSSGRGLGIIHRDVSPSNVMLSRTGEVKLVDFGIARAADRSGLSVSGVLQGKYAYMSPQQAAGGELDARSDQFSVGVLAWELLAGQRPFDGDTDLETLDRIRHHEPGSLAHVLPEAPEALVAAIDRMLLKDPEGRFEDASAAAKAIQAFLFAASEMVGPRDLQAFYERCLETLPEAQRDAVGQALSLNDALNLHLASDPGVAARTATGTLSVAAHHSSPGVMSAPDQATPTGSPAADPTLGRIPSQADMIAAVRGRSRWMSLLVLLNFALLAAVGALVADRFASSPTPTQMLSTQESKPASGPQPQIDEVLPSNPMAKDRQRSAASAEVRAPLSRPTAPSDAPIAPVENSKTSIVTPQADSERRPVEVSESVLVRTQPMKATVSYQGRSLGTSPVTVELARDEKRVLTISYPGYVTRQVTVTGGKRAAIRVTLKPTGQGRVTLRYFPASATVKINGKVVSKPSTNRIDHRLDVGQHRLTISDQRGRSRVIPFEVERDKTRNLATISLEPQPERP